jgi:hypothetical protein
MPVVQIVRRNLVIVSLTSYYISHAGKTGTWYRMAYDFMRNMLLYEVEWLYRISELITLPPD